MSNPMDITLYGDSLKAWKEWAVSLEKKEPLLGLAIIVTKVSASGSMPLWLIAVIIGLPLTFLDILTLHLFCAPLRVLIAPLIAWVRTSSDFWARSPVARPFLILPMPIVIVLSMILIHLIPQEPDIKQTKDVLVELWPLTERRLEWIATHGNGKAAQEAPAAAH